ncbi:MAG: hypothetical protein HQK55_13575 [Deltaproteobacteria bacterium]|nr:hypothetical protein [Deltaproteobacteria bacterium]
MPPIVCFIDDSAFELEVFSRNIIPVGVGLEFVLGSTYEEVRHKIGSRYPCLFLLDLYGRDPNLPPARLPSLDDLAAESLNLKSLPEVYAGLEDHPGDKVNEYLKRLFHVVDGWRRLFYRASRQAGQNINYGLNNLAAVRRDFPGTAAVGYTRKSLIMDAVDVIKAGMDGLALKPDGPDDQAIQQATADSARALLAAWAEVISKCQAEHRKDLSLKLYQADLGPDVPRLSKPETLSSAAQDLLGQRDLDFLRAGIEGSFFVG